MRMWILQHGSLPHNTNIEIPSRRASKPPLFLTLINYHCYTSLPYCGNFDWFVVKPRIRIINKYIRIIISVHCGVVPWKREDLPLEYKKYITKTKQNDVSASSVCLSVCLSVNLSFFHSFSLSVTMNPSQQCWSKELYSSIPAQKLAERVQAKLVQIQGSLGDSIMPTKKLLQPLQNGTRLPNPPLRERFTGMLLDLVFLDWEQQIWGCDKISNWRLNRMGEEIPPPPSWIVPPPLPQFICTQALNDVPSCSLTLSSYCTPSLPLWVLPLCTNWPLGMVVKTTNPKERTTHSYLTNPKKRNTHIHTHFFHQWPFLHPYPTWLTNMRI